MAFSILLALMINIYCFFLVFSVEKNRFLLENVNKKA